MSASLRAGCLTAALGGCLLAASCGGNGPTQPGTGEREFLYAWSLLDAFYLFRGELPPDPFVFRTPQELYASVQDPYTAYLPRDSARLFLRALTTRSAGLGVAIDSVATGYVIIRVVPGSPAQQAGLQEHDTILSVNGSSLAGIGRDELPGFLGGESGDRKDLLIKRGDQVLQVSVTIDEFLAPSVFTDSLDSATAYIDLAGFLESTILPGGSAQEFDSALKSTRWAATTILDLRSNPGGEIEQCIRITSEFLDPGTPLVRTQERAFDPDRDSAVTIDTTWFSIDAGGDAVNRRFYVLVNGSSASAAEILVAGLHANRPDIITVGTRTFGKARGQILAITPDSALAKITYARLMPLSGESYDLVGIEPKVPVSPEQDALQVSLDLVGEGLAKRAVTGARGWSLISTGREPLCVKWIDRKR